jgi:hypothetical protein
MAPRRRRIYVRKPGSAGHVLVSGVGTGFAEPCERQFPTFMARRILARSLFVLASSPFTAPFSTCDLARFFGSAYGIALNTAAIPVLRSAPHNLSPNDNDAVLAVSLFAPTPGRAKPLAVAQNSPQPTSTNDRPDGTSMWALNPMHLPHGQAVAPKIMRL